MQLLLNCVRLQELHLQLVDTLDDLLWEQVDQRHCSILDKYLHKIFIRLEHKVEDWGITQLLQVATSNPLQHLVTATFDQCHGISASILFSELEAPKFGLQTIMTFKWLFGYLCLADLVETENQLEMLNVWSCRSSSICNYFLRSFCQKSQDPLKFQIYVVYFDSLTQVCKRPRQRQH